MTVRTARAADAGAVARIANAVIRDTLITFTTDLRQPEDIARQIAARAPRFLVAERDGQVVGHATYGPFRTGPGYAHTAEHSIQLDERARGQGLGRALMARLEAVARDDGIHVLVAGISGANAGGIGFHARLGFAEVGRMPQVGRKAGQWLDLVLMQKILSPRPQAAPDTATASG